MSRVGSQPIIIPEGVTVEIKANKVKVTGSKGGLHLTLPDSIKVTQDKKKLLVSRYRNDKKAKANHGTIRSLINNMIIGVTKEWEKELQVVGTGYRVDLQGNNLVFKLGFSHPVVFEAPEGVKFEVKDDKLKISGVDKGLVGNIAARIRKIKPPFTIVKFFN